MSEYHLSEIQYTFEYVQKYTIFAYSCAIISILKCTPVESYILIQSRVNYNECMIDTLQRSKICHSLNIKERKTTCLGNISLKYKYKINENPSTHL